MSSINPNIKLKLILAECCEPNWKEIPGAFPILLNSPQVVLTRILINALNIPFSVFPIPNGCIHLEKILYKDGEEHSFNIRVSGDFCRSWITTQTIDNPILNTTKVDTSNISDVLDVLNEELEKYDLSL